jgi:hypothetical protein
VVKRSFREFQGLFAAKGRKKKFFSRFGVISILIMVMKITKNPNISRNIEFHGSRSYARIKACIFHGEQSNFSKLTKMS